MPDSLPQNDHDTLTTLVADVKNMAKSQELFHAEVKDNFKDLKENYSSRLALLETALTTIDKTYQAKIDQEKINDSLQKRIGKLERTQLYYLGAGAAMAVVIIAAWQLFLAYIGKK